MSKTFFRPTRHHPRLRPLPAKSSAVRRVVGVDRQAATTDALMRGGPSPLRGLIAGPTTRVSGLPRGFPAELVEAVDDRPPAIGHHIRRAAVRVVALDLTQFPPILGALLSP